MRIDFRVPGQWWDFNESLIRALGLSLDKVQVRAFKGLHSALCEITQALSIQFPHKKKAYYFKAMGPSLEGAMMALGRAGVQVEALDLAVLQAQGGAKEGELWSEIFGQDSLCVVYSEDDPLLARRYPVEELESFLVQKKIFSLRVSHATFRFAPLPQELARPQLRFLSVSEDLAIALSHGRLRFLTPLAEGQGWDLEMNVGAFSLQQENRPLVEDFEGSSPGGAQALWPKGASFRLYDRALLYWPDMDGEAVIQLLAESLGHQLRPPGQDELMETTSLSRWGGVKTMDWLRDNGVPPEVIRGLIILDQSLLEDNSLAEKLASVRQRIVKLQNGD